MVVVLDVDVFFVTWTWFGDTREMSSCGSGVGGCSVGEGWWVEVAINTAGVVAVAGTASCSLPVDCKLATIELRVAGRILYRYRQDDADAARCKNPRGSTGCAGEDLG